MLSQSAPEPQSEYDGEKEPAGQMNKAKRNKNQQKDGDKKNCETLLHINPTEYFTQRVLRPQPDKRTD